MTKIRTGNVTKGRPGFTRGAGSMARRTGSFVSKTKASAAGVRRLIANNPAKGTSANIGTKNDRLRFSNNSKLPNMTSGSNPRRVKAPNFAKGNAAQSGKIKLRAYKNRAVKKLR
jgi:hypothetical protein